MLIPIHRKRAVQVDGVSTQNRDILAFDFIASIIYFDDN